MSEEFEISSCGVEDMALIVDKKNIAKEVDEIYAQKLVSELRLQLGWEIKNGSPVYHHIRKFSRLYSNEQRDVDEVVAIYRIAFRPGQGAQR